MTPVTPVPASNTAPVLVEANADQAAEVGTSFDYDATQGGTTFSDAELTYTMSFDPSGTGLSAANGQISGTPLASGPVAATITATDPDGAAVSDLFEIAVTDPPAAAVKPNILLIIADDLGQDSSAQYALSTDLPDTPVLDGLARDGLVFENLWVNPTCSPTRSTLLSARYGERTDVLEPGDPLPAGETILHAALDQDAATTDYVSALVGKWHLGGGSTGPNTAGLEHFAGITGGGVSDYYDWTLTVNGTNSQSSTYVTTELTDQEIGRLLATLSAAERANTVILFIGDNGTPGQVRDRSVFPSGAKGSLFEGGVRVPMIVSGSGVTRINQRETALINGTDFFSTISQLAGGSTAAVLDSQSFSGLLTDTNTASRDYLYSELPASFAVRGPRYKLIEDLTGTQRLYDLETDSLEDNDLLGTSMDVTAILNDLEAARDAIR